MADELKNDTSIPPQSESAETSHVESAQMPHAESAQMPQTTSAQTPHATPADNSHAKPAQTPQSAHPAHHDAPVSFDAENHRIRIGGGEPHRYRAVKPSAEHQPRQTAQRKQATGLSRAQRLVKKGAIRQLRRLAALKRTADQKGHPQNLKRYALPAAAVVAVGLFGCYWLFWRSFPVQVNNTTLDVRAGTSVEQLLKDHDYFGVKPGRLVSVSQRVLSEQGGARSSVEIDGKELSTSDYATTNLKSGEHIVVGNGADVTEDHTEKTVDIDPPFSRSVGGAVQFVSQWGKKGKKVVWQGKVSGETVDKKTLEEPVPMVVNSLNPHPAGSGKYIALTFDDGPSVYTPQVLDILKQKGAKATFFNMGQNASHYPEYSKRVIDEGFQMGNHTNKHQDLPACDTATLRSEITTSAESIKAASGVDTRLFRAPYGAFGDTEWERSADLIACNVLWNIDTLDWKRPGADAITKNVLNNAYNGAIVLMHDGGGNREQDVQALPGIIDGLRAQGYELVTVSELMAQDPRFPKDVVEASATMPNDADLPAAAQ